MKNQGHKEYQHLTEMNLSPLVAVTDIETLSTEPNAVIASIGCVLVNVLEGTEAGRFYVRCDIEQQEETRHTCDNTVEWWESQLKDHPDAYMELYGEELPRLSLRNALESFALFLQANFGDTKIQVMGNGAEFDNVILANAYKQLEIVQPWHYGGNQSLRTVVWLGRLLRGVDPKYDGDFIGTKHHALHDAAHEARYLMDTVKHFYMQHSIGFRTVDETVELAPLEPGECVIGLTDPEDDPNPNQSNEFVY